MEFANCEICDSSNFTVLKSSNLNRQIGIKELAEQFISSSTAKLAFQLVKCIQCDLIFVNPRIKSSVILNSYATSIDTNHQYQSDYRIKSFKRALIGIERYLNNSNLDFKKSNILDIGCAGGAFLKAAEQLNYTALGLEPSNNLTLWAKENLKVQVIATTLEKYSKDKTKKFSMVTFWDVLEHIHNPSKILRCARKILKDEGILIINIPMVDSIPAILLRGFWPFYLNVHLFYFTRKTIIKLLEKNGFEVIHIKNYWQCLSLGYVLTRANLPISSKILKKLRLPVWYYLGQRTIIAKKI
jgi:2-polyprenyl-3-methyl-5-hydroxy-6-metoxy-1,4-benzoquinol methylase